MKWTNVHLKNTLSLKSDRGMNMSKYVDADKLMETIRDNDYTIVDEHNSFDNGMFTIEIQQAVDEQPAADVEEVKHGKYVNNQCTVCGEEAPTDSRLDFIGEEDVNYCFNCGAKMDL